MKQKNLNPYEDEVELTLKSLDDVNRAGAPDDFLQEMMQKTSFISKPSGWEKWAKLSIAAMIALTIVNVVTLSSFGRENNDRSNQLQLIESQFFGISDLGSNESIISYE
ncbi:MAG: hypothetical protein KI790_04910 [Cyclobacteriaceae bacterium]|nr:hypothetical protein [Cyclobacteriaceae bacterium HetDA_MAG_MS6]